MIRPTTISLEQLQVGFGDQSLALESTDLNCPAGQFLAITGPSGCGKSTLLRCVAGLQSPSSGHVRVTTSTGETPRLAFVFQDPTLLPWRNVWDNIGLPMELAGVDRQRRLEATRAALDLIGLTERDGNKFPAMLSGGMRMRVSLARAIVTEPDVLLLDEPFAALDEITRQQLQEELLRLWQRHQWTVLFVTHHVGEAVFLSQRVLVLSKRPGRILADLPIISTTTRTADWRMDAECLRTSQLVATQLRKAL